MVTYAQAAVAEDLALPKMVFNKAEMRLKPALRTGLKKPTGQQ